MPTNHQTRCAWIQQNDAVTEDHIPFLCGPAAAQMILYGRTDAKFSGGDTLHGLAVLPVLPVAAWEFALGVWLIVKGFKPSPITTGMTATGSTPAYDHVTV